MEIAITESARDAMMIAVPRPERSTKRASPSTRLAMLGAIVETRRI